MSAHDEPNFRGDIRKITIRRNVQQVKHCVVEALSVIEHDEDLRSALDDLEQASQLLQDIKTRIREQINKTMLVGKTR